MKKNTTDYEGEIKIKHYRDRQLLFYDIEVFYRDWVIVFKNENKEVVQIFHCGENKSTRPDVFEVTNKAQLGLIQRLIKNATLVSYNGHHYDDKVISGILKHGENLRYVKALNDTIIEDKSKVYSDFRMMDIWTLDLSKEIEGSQVVKGKTYPPPLKQIESQMGLDIVETSIDFNITRALTTEEVDSTIKYCVHDVDALIEIFKIREPSYLVPKQVLIERLNELYPLNFDYGMWLSMNVTTIMGKMLMNESKNTSWDRFMLFPVDPSDPQKAGKQTDEFLEERIKSGFPAQVVDMWKAAYYDEKDQIFVKPKAKTVVTMNGIKYVFGFGGLHGEPAKHNKKFSSMIMLDVRSLYPNIMINLKTLGHATGIFSGIVEERAKVKHTNKLLSDGLKLGINKVYGCLGSKYSKLYNRFGTLSVCVYGQMILFDLCQRLETLPGLKLLNINTDGVGFNYDGPKEDWQRIWHEWENMWNLVLEEDYFSEVFQKDVNNYVGVVDGEPKKAIGAMVKYYKKQEFFKNGSLRIIHICLVEALTKGIHPRHTIKKYRDQPMLFMQTCYVGRSFSHVVNEKGEILPQKVNRVFAVSEPFKELEGIWKARPDGSKVIFPNLPSSLIIYNDDLSKFTDFKQKIDIVYYQNLALASLKKWGISEDDLN